jgi:hypothetical protein
MIACSWLIKVKFCLKTVKVQGIQHQVEALQHRL